MNTIEYQTFTSNPSPSGDSATIGNFENFVLQKPKKNSKKSVLQKSSESSTVSYDSPVTQGQEDYGNIFQEDKTSIPAAIADLLQGRSVNDIDDILIKLDAELFKKDFYEFIKEFISEVMVEKAVFGEHMKYIALELQAITFQIANRQKKEQDLIINICPGMTKSTLCSVLWPVWCWIVDPTISFITASHDQDLANRFANKSRDLIKSDKFKKYFPHIKLSTTQDNKGDYENTLGGYRLSTSSKSSPTGRHALILLSDDIQNRDNADSEIERNNVNRWYSETFASRKSNKSVAVMVVVQQRLHQQDITGYLLERGENYKQICLPAEISDKVKPESWKTIYQDGLLDPKRLTPEIILQERMSLGNRAYETQYNQDPQSEEAAILKTAMFPIISVSEFDVLKTKTPSPVLFFADTAYTEKTSNDPSAILACVKIGELMYITNISVVRLEFPKLLKHFKTWTDANGYSFQSKITVEPKGSGQSIVQMLKIESGLNIKEGISPKAGKEERLNAISNIVDSSRVCLVQGGWNNLFLSEVTASSPRHDDIRDCLVMAVENLLVKPKGSGKYNFASFQL